MKKPKMVLFDYGNVLVDETGHSGLRGTRALMSHITHNPRGWTAEQIQSLAEQLLRELGYHDEPQRHAMSGELYGPSFNRLLYGLLDIRFDFASYDQQEDLFWAAACPGKLPPDIGPFLNYLKTEGIPAGVVSNLTFSLRALEARLDRFYPDHPFSFIIGSSDVVFRKPHSRIFELACVKAGLESRDIFFCGDTEDTDILGARAAGMTPVHYLGLRPGREPAPGCLAVRSWMELEALIRSME